MKTITYYRALFGTNWKFIVTADTIEVYERSLGKWVGQGMEMFYFAAGGTKLQARLDDGSFFAMIRKRL